MAKVIGIDLGGTKISGILMDEKFNILKKEVRPTEPEKGKAKVIENIVAVIDVLKDQEVSVAGIAMPGHELPDGRVHPGPNIPALFNARLRRELEKKTKLKTTIANDANCFALAEQKNGAAKGCKNVVGVIIGTGVGGGIIIDGKLYVGSSGGAGEIGHSYLCSDGEADDRKPIDIENLISGTAFLKKYNVLSGKNLVSLKDADTKENAYKKAYESFVFYTGVFFANLVNIFDPERIVVGGGVSNIDFYKDVGKITKKYSLPDRMGVCKIVKNRLGDDSGVIGAAMLALGLN
jgi:fructokinase